jgi:hypothetical protein
VPPKKKLASECDLADNFEDERGECFNKSWLGISKSEAHDVLRVIAGFWRAETVTAGDGGGLH